METTYSVPGRFFTLFRVLCVLGEIGAHAARANAPQTVAAPVEDRRRACCDKAIKMPRGFARGACVCDESWTCTTHGETHHGSHE